MAIYHLSGTIISRSQGRSAVACSAYRSGEVLNDERYQKVQDYSRRTGVMHREILLPKDAPEWMAHRETLWNAVEAFEKRKDAQLSREFNFALPRELTLAQNEVLARTFIQSQFVDKGMVADWCIHEEKGLEGELLYHSHVMLTMREVTSEGFGQKVRVWNDKERLLAWREAWASEANQHLALHGHDQQIDHRTLEAQSIALEPQHKIGPSQARELMARLEDHQRIARENGERLLKDPGIALKALTQQQSTFTHQGIARFVNRQTVDAEQFEKVYEAIKGCPGLVRLGLDERQRERFTSREMLALESKMLNQAKALSEVEGYSVGERQAKAALESRTLSVEQKGVFEYLLSPDALKCVVGYAGTGKSYLLGATKEAWDASGFRVQGVTLSGIAAESLEGSSGIESRTFASRCWFWDRGEQKLGSRDILVVDEAGMLGSRAMARLIQEASEAKAKVVLVGDPQQLQAIEAGGAFRAILERNSWIELTEVRRQTIPWQCDATKEFAQGKVALALNRYEVASHVHEYTTISLAKEGIVSFWNEVRLQNPTETQIMLAYTREDVLELNQRARSYRKEAKELGTERAFQTTRGERLFAEKDRVYFLNNDRSLNVRNGTLGTIESLDEQTLNIRLDKEERQQRTVRIDIKQYPHLEYGYAATIYKVQGVTVDRSHLLASKYCDAHAAYVGMTRHRNSADLFWSREEFPKYQDLVNTLSRNRTKDVSLDYETAKQEFGKNRGVESEPIIQRVITAVKHGFEKSRDILRDFKAKFEAENPEKAAQLRYEILPKAEKEVIQRERQLQAEALEQQKQAKALQIETQEKALKQQKELEISRGIDRGGWGL
jgi:Ti-type conjugative transfer relaxase TraA